MANNITASQYRVVNQKIRNKYIKNGKKEFI